MKGGTILITGGAGFIGSWTVRAFLADTSCNIVILDNFSNGSKANLESFRNDSRILDVIKCDVANSRRTAEIVSRVKPDICVHLAAQINVQHSIDDPCDTFRSDVTGTFHLLEACRAAGAKFAFMSTCMVYDLSAPSGSIAETHPAVPRSPYAAAKLAGENLTVSYFHAYGMPTVVMRPFNTYGPRQKASGEGGVVSIFLSKHIKGENLNIYGTGRQTRDLLYVEDCADFILRAVSSKKCYGRIINAATGSDITVNDLAALTLTLPTANPGAKIKHVKHIHPQSEIMKLCGNYDLVASLLGWRPKTDLRTGLEKTSEWLTSLIEKGDTRWL